MPEPKAADQSGEAPVFHPKVDREREMSAMVLALTRVVAGDVPSDAEGLCSFPSGVLRLKRGHGDSLAEASVEALWRAPGRGSSVDAARGNCDGYEFNGFRETSDKIIMITKR